MVGGAAGKKMCEKEAKKNISERKVKNKSDEKTCPDPETSSGFSGDLGLQSSKTRRQ